MANRVTWCDRTGDANLGRWAELKRWVAAHGFMVGRDCLEQTTGGIHASGSLHYSGMAVDFGDVGVDYVAIARWLVQYAQGPDRLLDELFCSDDGIAWSHGSPSNFHDNPAHTHAGLRAGAQLPLPRQRRETLGAYGLESVAPGESKTYRLLPPGGGAIGPIDDPIYVSIPFDELGKGPGLVRWAIVDQGGKVIASNDDSDPAKRWKCSQPGFLLQAHAGAFNLVIENKEPAGGRRVGQGLVEWQYKPTAAAAMAVQPAHGEAPAAALIGTDSGEAPETPGGEPEPTAEPPESP